MTTFDVIVVGGGPGGSSAAYDLVRGGARVAILDKARFPRYKTCGGAVPAEALRQFPFDFDGVASMQVSRVRYSLAAQEEMAVDLPGRPVTMFMRDRLDTCLLHHSGAEVRDGCAVREVGEEDDGVRVVTERGEVLYGKYLIGADGSLSLVAKQLSLPHARRPGAALEVEFPAPARLLQEYTDTALFDFGAVRNGYLWIFPKGEHLSVGIGIMRGGTHADLKAILWREMERFGLKLDGAKIHAHPIPVYPGRKRMATRRCLLVGDAAGLADGLIGEGIRYSMKSGRLAAQSILQGRIAEYETQVHRQIGDSLKWANRSAVVFYRAPRFCFRVGVANPRATAGFAAVLSDQRTYGWLVPYIFGCIGESLVTLKWMRTNPQPTGTSDPVSTR